jgi:hypothetical protein
MAEPGPSRKRRQRAVARAAAAAIGWAIALVVPAGAQLVDCPGIRNNPSTFKVIFDDPAYARQGLDADGELQTIKARLQFAVDGQLQALGMEMRQAAQPAAQLLSVSCPGRHPRGESDFDLDRSQDLTASKVVLEVWATLDGRSQGNNLQDREARIGYALPPLRFYERGAPGLPGFYQLRYPRPGADLSGILTGLPEISAYATLGLGLKAAKAQDYDLAVQYLKKAEALLAAAGPNPDPDAANRRALVDYAKRKSCETVRAALADPGYAGGLKIAYAGARRPCP